ncbi:MAG: DUF4968 domain-containing protein, partial [Lachnospiraceae bacterium]|nr:DUF4968 domain-containing protein [Lachnospiraceae bacterium]
MKAGKLKSYEVSGQEVRLIFEQLEAKITVVTPEIIRVFADLDGVERTSKAIEGDKSVPVNLHVEEKIDG